MMPSPSASQLLTGHVFFGGVQSVQHAAYEDQLIKHVIIRYWMVFKYLMNMSEDNPERTIPYHPEISFDSILAESFMLFHVVPLPTVKCLATSSIFNRFV